MSSRLGGRYQLVREIGVGGMGRVFQAVDTETGRSVAAKIMLAGNEDDLEALLRFYQEGAVLSALTHPNIVKVYGTFLEEHTCWIIMELLEGQSLSQLMREGAQPQGLPLHRIQRIAYQVASALDFAHSRAIVHRDIKPDNIMVDGNDHVKVTDFGIARINRSAATLQTAVGVSIGTPLYMAPEQIEGQKVDGRADIYALGTVLYQMVAGHPPFEGDDPLTVAFKHVHKAPQPPTELNRNVPGEWEALILKTLAKDPADRFQTAAALAEAITALPTDSRGDAAAGGSSTFTPPRPAVSQSSHQQVSQSRTIPPQVTPTHIEPQPVATVEHPADGRTAVAARKPFPWLMVGGAILVLLALVVGFLLYRALSPGGSATPTATPQVITRGAILHPLAQWGAKGSGPGQFNNPRGVATDTQGNVYVADSDNHRIQKLSAAGKALTAWGTQGSELGQVANPAGVAVAAGGTVYIADTGNSRIQVLSPAGKLVSVWGGPGSATGQFDHPAGIAVGADGNIYVADTGNNRVKKLSPSGKVLGAWGIPGSDPGQFKQPMGIAADAQGNVFVADTGNNRIQELASTSDPLAQWGTKGSGVGQFNSPRGIALDAQGNLYVADTGNNRIEKLSSSGKYLGAFGGTGSGSSQFKSPEALTVDSHGDVYVADAGNNRIQKLGP